MAYPPKRPPFWQSSSDWAQHTLASLSLDEKIAQLLHVATWSDRGPDHEAEIQALVETYGIGGLCFFQGTAAKQAAQTKRYQAASKVPLMISIDGEWGLAMRLRDTLPYPYQIALGQVKDLDLLYEMGADMARQCKAIGIHVNFAPVVDINTEPANPVIGFRSFGDNPEQVAACALAYARGMEDEGVLAVLKHFPGHGDTAVDSHLDLPVLKHDIQRLEQVELAPFAQLIDAGIGGVMTGHLHVPVFDDRPRIGATLSRTMSHDLLQEKMGFQGMVFTDALDMKGVSKYFSAADINRLAFEAGNDVMLFCVDVPGSMAAIRQSIECGQISEADLDRRVLKQLKAKAWLEVLSMPQDSSAIDLQSSSRKALIERLHRASLHWRHSDHPPILSTGDAWLHITPGRGDKADGLAHHQLTGGQSAEAALVLTALKAEGFSHLFSLTSDQSPEDWEAVLDQVAAFPHCWVSVAGLGIKAGNRFGITAAFETLLQNALSCSPKALVWQANPYALNVLPDVDIPILITGPETALAIPGIIGACLGQ